MQRVLFVDLDGHWAFKENVLGRKNANSRQRSADPNTDRPEWYYIAYRSHATHDDNYAVDPKRLALHVFLFITLLVP